MAAKFSVTLFHLSVPLRGGKKGWSVPNSILLLPSLRSLPSLSNEEIAEAEAEGVLYVEDLPIALLTNPSSSEP